MTGNDEDRFTKDAFTFIKASFEGGVRLECWRNYELGQAEEVMTAIWRDAGQQFVVTTAAAEVPLHVWESFIAEARSWCPKPDGKL